MRDESSVTDEARLRSLSLSPSNLAPIVEPRGSGAAMSPFPDNPSPRLAADRPGLGLPPPELPLSEVPASISAMPPHFTGTAKPEGQGGGFFLQGIQDSHSGYPSLAV